MKEDILHSALKEVQLYGNFESHKAEIDAEDLSWILQILSTNLYSDPIGSLIREYSSNAWDANIEAGNKSKPIEVGIQTSADTGSYWYVTDLGPGLSPQRINEVYRKFGKSTKRTSNEAIGMMGLGKFSGLSYTNEVFISTRVDGMQYEYLMHKSEGVPQIDLLVTKLTDLPNGTTIRINIKSWSDKLDFITKTKQQLAFFENVYFNIDSENINEKFKIVKANTFTYSSIESRGLRLKIGPVSYPIDWTSIKNDFKLQNVASDCTGIAINFNIGDIAITPNRESILYNKQTLENVEAKLVEFRNELLMLYENQSHEYEDLEDFVYALRYPIVTVDTRRININSLINPHTNKVYPKIKDLPIEFKLNSVGDLFFGYAVTQHIRNGRKSDSNYSRAIPDLKKVLNNGVKYLFAKTLLDPKHNKFIASKFKQDSWYVVRKTRYVRLYPSKDARGVLNYYELLSLSKVPKKQWRETIKTFQAWQDKYVTENSVIYEDHPPTKEWLLAQKQNKVQTNDAKSLRKNAGKILVEFPENRGTWTFAAPIFRSADMLIAKLSSQKHFTIYGTKDDKTTLGYLYFFTRLAHPKVKVMITAKANHKYLALVPSYIHIDEFLKGKTKLFRYYASLLKFTQFYDSKYKRLYECRELLKQLHTPSWEIVKQAGELNATIDERIPFFRKSWNADERDQFAEKMLTIASENNAYDSNIETLISQLEKINKYDFITLIEPSSKYGINSYEKKPAEFARFVAKAKKCKLDLKYYQNDGTAEEHTGEL